MAFASPQALTLDFTLPPDPQEVHEARAMSVVFRTFCISESIEMGPSRAIARPSQWARRESKVSAIVHQSPAQTQLFVEYSGSVECSPEPVPCDMRVS